ncbi:hypothetical protein Tco_0709624 [Tanacetum coccineum]
MSVRYWALWVLPLELNKLLIIVAKPTEVANFDALVILGSCQLLVHSIGHGIDGEVGWPHLVNLDSQVPILYGDGSRAALLESAGISSPKAVMVMYEGRQRAVKAVERIRLAFPAVIYFALLQTSLQLGSSKLLKGLGVKDKPQVDCGSPKKSKDIGSDSPMSKWVMRDMIMSTKHGDKVLNPQPVSSEFNPTMGVQVVNKPIIVVVADKADVVKKSVVADKAPVIADKAPVVVDKPANVVVADNLYNVGNLVVDVVSDKVILEVKPKAVVHVLRSKETHVKRKRNLLNEDDSKKKVKVKMSEGKSKKKDSELETDEVDSSSNEVDQKQKKLKLKGGLRGNTCLRLLLM